MPRWLLLGLFMIVVAALATTFWNVKRVNIPEDCQKAGSALEANDYSIAIDHYLLCLDAGELPTEILAQVEVCPHSAKWSRGRVFHRQISPIKSGPQRAIVKSW